VAHSQATRLSAIGLAVGVLTSDPASRRTVGERPGDAPEAFEVHRARAWNGLEGMGVPFPVFSPALLWKSFSLVRRADVVHVHDVLYLSSWVTGFWCRLLRRPLVVTQHVPIVEHPSWVVALVQRLVYRSVGRQVLMEARRIAVLNSTVRSFITGLGIPDEKIILLANGVDLETFFPPRGDERAEIRARWNLPADRTLALFVGRFVPKKGFTRLLAAASDDYTLVFAGGDAPAEHADDPRFVFLGSLGRAEVAEIYRACDLFILPSQAEGFPLTVQEAMACDGRMKRSQAR
jgi:glycosyltransferase involved in cell wall biosynthesis